MISGVSRTRTLLAAIVLSALALGGCSDDPEPRSDPGPAPPSTSAVSPSAAGEADDPRQSFRTWIEARNEALHSGDTARVESLSTDDCGSCQNSIDPIREVHSKGGRFETVGWLVDSVTLENETEITAKLSAAITYAEGKTYPSANADPISYEEEHHIVLVKLEKLGGRWLLSEIGYVS